MYIHDYNIVHTLSLYESSILETGISVWSYRRSRMPLAIADRDLVQYIGQRFDEPTNTTYLLYHNATHPKVPEKRGLVR